MAELETIDLGKEDYERALDNIINYGGESSITLGRARNTIFKIFHEDYLDEHESFRERKEKKIKLLAQATGDLEIPFFPKIYSILTYENDFIGYEMEVHNNDVSLDIMSDYLSKEELITVLKEVKEYLEFLHRHPLRIVYGDVFEPNILFDESNEGIRLCDIDNISVMGLGFESMRDIQANYLHHHKGKITPELDVYMHNVLTRDLIFGSESINPLVKKYIKYKPKGYLIDEL